MRANCTFLFKDINAPKDGSCSAKDGDEDVEIGRCLESVGAVPIDTRDEIGRFRFFPLSPKMFTFPGTNFNTSIYLATDAKKLDHFINKKRFFCKWFGFF